MRFYSFTNMYTSGIHAGIQTAHAVHEMQSKYAARNSSDDMQAHEKYLKYIEWAERHKTIIVKCAGYHSTLNDLYDELKESSAWLQLPLIKWCESKEALNGATTAVGIIVPADVYTIPTPRDAIPMTAEGQLAAIINRYPMAK